MKPIIIALTVFSFLAAPAAIAQPYPLQGDKPSHSQMHKVGPKYDARKHDNSRHQSWKRGSRLPANYRGYVVNNYASYELRKPPRGYQWVKVNNDYMLIGITTGIISSIVAGR
ncbi:RcnB family protein [Ochrobactrum sp. CGA5]|uniref:RcnB family protein n=1 Tax=Ochrobactrum sp. CGA5 TaxID=2583453 RepID=UPI001122D571|nr:RcnB family protein [Ochrobactrum sp. CGA5]